MAFYKRQVVYKKCVYNHAASLGKVARDGCYKFIQPPLVDDVDGSPEEAMRCAICKCHRNYHRRQVVYTRVMPPEREEPVVAAAAPRRPPRRPGRRQRTQFTEEQKSRMARFAERMGWRVKRSDNEEILRFCIEIGIDRQMFVVWLHNNRPRSNPNQIDHNE